jgi:hypothetical protein
MSTETIPVRWPVRLLLRLTRKGRAREAAAEFEKEMAEENAFYTRPEA